MRSRTVSRWQVNLVIGLLMICATLLYCMLFPGRGWVRLLLVIILSMGELLFIMAGLVGLLEEANSQVDESKGK